MTAIDDFLAQKQLSENSKAAYRYDLEQFRQLVAGDLSQDKLKIYQNFLSQLKASVQKRKLSAVNQFLDYLYRTSQINTYYRLETSLVWLGQDYEPNLPEKIDLQGLEEASSHKTGQLIALLIAHLGLQPSELSTLEVSALDLDFKVVTVLRGKSKRILKLPDLLLPYLAEQMTGRYLFGKDGQPYSRQWFFRHLNLFLAEVGLGEMTAQKLRQQFILHALDEGKSHVEIAQQLGLKSIITLEKYVKTNGYKN